MNSVKLYFSPFSVTWVTWDDGTVTRVYDAWAVPQVPERGPETDNRYTWVEDANRRFNERYDRERKRLET